MISFIKKMFCGNQRVTDSNGLPILDSLIPMPKVKPPKPAAVFGKNSVILPDEAILVKTPPVVISEPVHSFIACVKANPGRFEVGKSVNYNKYNFSHSIAYSIKDKKTDYQYVITKEDLYGGDYLWERSDNISFLTYEECNHLVNKIVDIYCERFGRYNKIINQRKRRALTKIYGAQQ